MGNLIEEVNHSELTSLDLVIKETVKTLEVGREQVFVVAENARNECSRLHSSLYELDRQAGLIKAELDVVREDEKSAQEQVATITKNFDKYSEEEIKSAYEKAKELQIKLTLLNERLKQLEQKKEEIKTGLSALCETAEKAETMVSNVGVVMDFIKGNLRDINVKLESLHQRQHMGLQIIRAQEEERKRVAREIHDGPAQSMANVVLRMEFCEKLMDFDPDKVRGEIVELKEVVRNNLQDIRKIIFDLRPMAIDDLGVIPALKRYIEDFQEKNEIDIEVSFTGKEDRMDPALEIALFRLIQEALNNVNKHARAKKVKVSVETENKWIKATVEDDGIGFDLRKFLHNHTGTNFGLLSMRERVDLLGGKVHFNTKPGKGTSVSFKIPVGG